MTNKHVIVEIDLEGNVTFETFGFKGAECEQATKAIEEALGQKTASVKKAEYYQSATHAQQRVGGSQG